MLENLIKFLIMDWKPLFEIILLWTIIYHVLLFFEGTRAIQVLRGIIIIFLAFFLSQKMGFEILGWLLTKLFGISVIAILIIFHPEIRQGLARLGRRHLFGAALREEELDSILREIAKAADNLCRNKIGALIVIENKDPLASYIETGVITDSKVSSEMIETIFTPNSLLHDGGIVIKNDRIASCGCILPLATNQELNRMFGTRHRAALGLSEETDAVIIVISEERHDMSLVHQSRLYRDLGKDEIFLKIKDLLKLKGRK